MFRDILTMTQEDYSRSQIMTLNVSDMEALQDRKDGSPEQAKLERGTPFARNLLLWYDSTCARQRSPALNS